MPIAAHGLRIYNMALVVSDTRRAAVLGHAFLAIPLLYSCFLALHMLRSALLISSDLFWFHSFDCCQETQHPHLCNSEHSMNKAINRFPLGLDQKKRKWQELAGPGGSIKCPCLVSRSAVGSNCSLCLGFVDSFRFSLDLPSGSCPSVELCA